MEALIVKKQTTRVPCKAVQQTVFCDLEGPVAQSVYTACTVACQISVQFEVHVDRAGPVKSAIINYVNGHEV